MACRNAISKLIFLGMVNFDCDAITILPKIPDDNMRVSVNGTDVPGPIHLAIGDTRIETKVCSADGTKSQVRDHNSTKFC